jgi:hypothetical protein
MPYMIGIILSVAVAVLMRSIGFDRDRAFYPTVVIVVAAYYVLFAAMAGETHVLIVESIVMLAFVAVAVLGFKLNAWLVVAALAGHGVLDVLHPRLVHNAGVPEWWPAFCMTFDVGAAALLASLVARGSVLDARRA